MEMRYLLGIVLYRVGSIGTCYAYANALEWLALVWRPAMFYRLWLFSRKFEAEPLLYALRELSVTLMNAIDGVAPYSFYLDSKRLGYLSVGVPLGSTSSRQLTLCI